jgi:hypothetical protein
MATAPYTIIKTISLTNIGNQTIKINVQRQVGSLIFTGYGMTEVRPKAMLEAEENRFDQTTLRSLSNKKMISYEKLDRRVEVTYPPTSTGSGSA